MFEGAFVALATPMKNGQIDEEAFRKLIKSQIESGINGLVPCGSTGEAATMTMEEHKKMIQITVELADGKIPVIP